MRSERNFTLTATPEAVDLVDTAVFGDGNFLLASAGDGVKKEKLNIKIVVAVIARTLSDSRRGRGNLEIRFPRPDIIGARNDRTTFECIKLFINYL